MEESKAPLEEHIEAFPLTAPTVMPSGERIFTVKLPRGAQIQPGIMFASIPSTAGHKEVLHLTFTYFARAVMQEEWEEGQEVQLEYKEELRKFSAIPDRNMIDRSKRPGFHGSYIYNGGIYHLFSSPPDYNQS
jgi:hypothetical protein